MDSDVLASMGAEIANGIPKGSSRFKSLPGFSATWDRIAAEMAAIRKVHPRAQFDLPNEFPDAS
jgi:hypothetical protein